MVWHPQDASPSAAESRMMTSLAVQRLVFEHKTPSEPLVLGKPPLMKRGTGPKSVHSASVQLHISTFPSELCFIWKAGPVENLVNFMKYYFDIFF